MSTHRATLDSVATDGRDHGPAKGIALALLAALLPVLGACDDDGPVEPLRPQASSSDAVALPFFVENEEGVRLDQVEDPGPEVMLFDDIEGQPVMAPDDRQVSWGQWTDVSGSISVTCLEDGTRVSLELSGLVPNGVYTLWNVVFDENGFTGEFDAPGLPSNVIAFGPSGPSDGSQSVFTASAAGAASITAVTPPGELGVMGEIGACALTDEFEWHVVGLYHIDGMTYGSTRGPEGTRAEQFAFIFGGPQE